MFKIEIMQREVFGYDEPVNGWRCPLCKPYSIYDNLDPLWVQNHARTHLYLVHRVASDLIEVEFVCTPKLYALVVYNPELKSSGVRLSGDLIYMAAIVIGEFWVSRYPNDIVMLVEE